MICFINLSNISVGGAVQVALSFVYELDCMSDNNEYHVLCSSVMFEIIKNTGVTLNIYCITKAPAKIIDRLSAVKELNFLERSICPNVIFTLFGPSYWKPKAMHIMGLADGWVYNPDTLAYFNLSLYEKIIMRMKVFYKKYYIKRDSSCYILETDDAVSKMKNVLNKKNIKYFVVGNTFNHFFRESEYILSSNNLYIKLPKCQNKCFKFLYICHNHPSKNLSAIYSVAKKLIDENVQFIVTIDNVSFVEIFSGLSNVVNIGPIDPGSCPSVYSQCDAIFAPTLLETFSAVYPESMKMDKPILTSDLSFAHDVCGDAALYFDPLSENDMINKINNIINNKDLYAMLIRKGRERLSEFESAKSRAIKYVEILNMVSLGK
jgi:glycosyltransferase involved in cell wall biosynthesis